MREAAGSHLRACNTSGPVRLASWCQLLSGSLCRRGDWRLVQTSPQLPRLEFFFAAYPRGYALRRNWDACRCDDVPSPMISVAILIWITRLGFVASVGAPSPVILILITVAGLLFDAVAFLQEARKARTLLTAAFLDTSVVPKPPCPNLITSTVPALEGQRNRRRDTLIAGIAITVVLIGFSYLEMRFLRASPAFASSFS
jgi:hypothetical protein